MKDRSLSGDRVKTPFRSGRWLGAALATAGLIWAWRGVEMDPWLLVRNAAQSLEFARGFLSPDFAHWRDILEQMVVTLQMALWGSLLATLGAIPLGLAASANVSPWWIRQPARRLLDLLRAINEMVFAFVFMVAVGLGPFAGTLALAIHTLGVLGKLFSEAVEGASPGPVEAIRATGASRLMEIIWGILPQVLPLWTSYALYRFEGNVRSATVVGIVGAGGIGYLLNESFRIYDYRSCSAIMLVIVGVVVLIDLLSSRVRQWML